MSGQPKRKEKAPRPVVEWVVGAMSALLVAALVAYLCFRALSGAPDPANLDVSISEVSHRNNVTTVRVAAINRGGMAASAVTVLAIGPDEAAVRRIEFDYIAAGATKYGAVLFPGTLAAGDIRVEAGGYVEP